MLIGIWMCIGWLSKSNDEQWFFFFLFFVFFGGQIFITWLQKTIQCNSDRLSLWRKCAKIVRFQWQDFWNCHSQTIGSSRLPRYSRILKTFYFPLWSVSKFNLALVKDHPCGYTTELKKNKRKTPISLNHDHLSIVSWNCDHFHFYQSSISPDKQRRVSILSKKEQPNCCDGSRTLQDSLL